jgi:hypothetical protein
LGAELAVGGEPPDRTVPAAKLIHEGIAGVADPLVSTEFMGVVSSVGA